MTPIRWTETAERDLSGIIEFVEADRPAAVERPGNSLFDLASSLGENPLRGAYVPELLARDVRQYRQVLHPPYRIIYSIRGGAVIIEAIADSRRNLISILAERLLR